MTSFFQKYASLFSTERFASNPGFHEKISLLFQNIPSTVALFISVAVFIFLPRHSIKRKIFGTALLLVLVATPAFVRLIQGYAYDSSFALIGWVGDLISLSLIAHFLGGLFLRNESHFLRIVSGSVFLLFAGFLLTLVGVQKWLGTPQPWVGLFFVGVISFYLIHQVFINKNKSQKEKSIGNNWRMGEIGLLIAVIALPIGPYLFTPAPPDSDVTVMSELTGLFLQGESLHQAVTGLPGEVLSIRYPSGTPGSAWLIAQLLGLFASEALTLLWLAAWILLVSLIVFLAKEIGATIWVVLLFSLNLTFTGAFGLGGGQIPEMLAYAFGIGMLALLIQKKETLSSAFLAAAMVLHPVVAIPFGLAWAVWICLQSASMWSKKTGKNDVIAILGSMAIKSILPLFAFFYLLGLTTGEGATRSHPGAMIAHLSFTDFFRNAGWWLDNDTFHLWIFLGVLVVPFLPSRLHPFRSSRRVFLLLFVWFLGACLINALFGSTSKHNYSATFQAGFSVAGIWVLCAGLLYSWVVSLSKSRVVPWLGAGGLLILWIWLVSPGFGLTPVSVFTTHSDIRMGRYLEKNISENSLVANVCPFSKSWGQRRSFYSMVRGDSKRNTIFNLFGGHQIKSGKQVDRSPFIDLTAKDVTLDQMALGFKKLGATHLFILSRPESDAYAASGKIKPLKKIGSSYLFDLTSL